MKVPVYVRTAEQITGKFLGHAEHTELPSVVELFNREPTTGKPATLNDGDWWPIYLENIDPDGYVLVEAQFSEGVRGSEIVFEVILAQDDD